MQRIFAFVLLACSIAFGRAATNNFAKWESEISKFEEADQKQMPVANLTLFVGSSSIRLWTNLAEAFPNVQTIRRGFGGSTTADLLHFADRLIIKYHPKHVLIYEGDNDLANGKSADEVIADFKALYEKIHSALPKTKVSYISIKPSPSREKIRDKGLAVNMAIKKMARFNTHLEYIDLWNPLLDANGKPLAGIYQKDNLHLNPAGYEIWRKVIAPKVK